uniref:Uncharacterized protein n=1 Tax=Caenorhabditis japonica TaxID=281687 RepID=A0A8R1DY44_CAEJA
MEVESTDGASKSSSSSSSAEDSDDDFEVEIVGKKGKNAAKAKKMDSSSSEGEDDDAKIRIKLAAIERKMDRDVKKQRLLQKASREVAEADGVDDGDGGDRDPDPDPDLICEFESNRVKKYRKRRVFRRKMLRDPQTAKRRRKIQRNTVDVTENFTCDTFMEFGSTVTSLVTEIDPNDEEIDHKALKRAFKMFGLSDSGDSAEEGSEEEDEADIIGQNLKFYQSRNARERIDQMNNLPSNPFAEKLVGYNNQKAIHGSNSSVIRNYHPDIFKDEKLHRLPPALVWERPFTHLVYQKSVFDPNQETNDFLRKIEEEKKKDLEQKLLDEIHERVRQKTIEKNPQLAVFDDSQMFYDDGTKKGETSYQLDCNPVSSASNAQEFDEIKQEDAVDAVDADDFQSLLIDCDNF